jgi:PH/SEC7 domain-containing protein
MSTVNDAIVNSVGNKDPQSGTLQPEVVADGDLRSLADPEADVKTKMVPNASEADARGEKSEPEVGSPPGMNGMVKSEKGSENETEDDMPEIVVESDLEAAVGYPKEDNDTPAGRARRLYSLDGYRKSQVAAELSKKTEFGSLVADEYLKYFDFSCDTLDQALRKFVSRFSLTGETFQRERIIEHFSRRFFECNPSLGIGSGEAVHTLACSLLLLNTDLHDENMIGKRMSFDDFVENLTGMCDGGDFPREYLKIVYHGIRSEALEWAQDEEKDYLETPRRKVGRGPKNSVVSLTNEGEDGEQKVTLAGTFVEVELDKNAKVFREGWLSKKCVMESVGKKTSLGKRSWKDCKAVLKGFLLYLNKKSRNPDKGDDINTALPVTHAYATVAMEYTKRNGVLRFTTSDWKVYLLAAPNAEDMHAWIQAINLAAALYSSPPLPAPIGSSKHFQRPVLPRHPAKLKASEQLQHHREKERLVADELIEHRTSKPYGRGAKRKLPDWQEKLSYLEYETRRYKGYVQAMEIDNGSRELTPALSCGSSSSEESDATLEDANTAVNPRLKGLSRLSSDRNSYKKAIYKSPSRKVIDKSPSRKVVEKN